MAALDPIRPGNREDRQRGKKNRAKMKNRRDAQKQNPEPAKLANQIARGNKGELHEYQICQKTEMAWQSEKRRVHRHHHGQRAGRRICPAHSAADAPRCHQQQYARGTDKETDARHFQEIQDQDALSCRGNGLEFLHKTGYDKGESQCGENDQEHPEPPHPPGGALPFGVVRRGCETNRHGVPSGNYRNRELGFPLSRE